jgi:hypothetical protein
VPKRPRAPEVVRKEMSDYLKKNARNKIVLLENEEEDGEEGQVGDAQEDGEGKPGTKFWDKRKASKEEICSNCYQVLFGFWSS